MSVTPLTFSPTTLSKICAWTLSASVLFETIDPEGVEREIMVRR